MTIYTYSNDISGISFDINNINNFLRGMKQNKKKKLIKIKIFAYWENE